MKQKASPTNNFHYNKKLKNYANSLRKNMNKAEACAWKYLFSRRQMKGYQFRRQRPVLNYIADFMCKELLLIIEIDGFSHDSPEAVARDLKKDADLREVGFTVLRFSNWEVLNRMEDVSIMISNWIEEHAPCPPPSPPLAGVTAGQDENRWRGDLRPSTLAEAVHLTCSQLNFKASKIQPLSINIEPNAPAKELRLLIQFRQIGISFSIEVL